MKYKKGSVYCFADIAEGEVFNSLKDVDTDNLPDDAQIPIEIPIFREGRFEHPLYETLKFDEQYLTSLISNHRKRVLPRAVSFDLDHRAFGGGAAAWLREDIDDPLILKTVDVPQPDGGTRKMSVLFAKMYLNRRGAQLVKSREYRYFSAEVHPNYSTRELIKLGKDYEIVKHGPVLLGGGLTNNPFIPGLGEYIFSADGETPEGFEGACVLQTDSEGGIYLFSVPEEGEVEEPSSVKEQEPERQSAPEPVQESNHKFGDKPMDKLLQLFANAVSDEAKLEVLSNASMEFSEDQDKLTAISLLRKQVEANIADRQAFNELVADNARKEERVKQLSADNANLKIEARKAVEVAYNTKVNLFCEELRSANHFESVVEKVKEVLVNSPVAVRDAGYKFSADQEETSDIMDVLRQIFAAVPSEARMNFTESLQSQEDELNGVVQTAPEGGTQEFSTEEDADKQENDAEAELARRAQLYSQEYGSACPEGWLKYLDENGRLQTAPVEG